MVVVEVAPRGAVRIARLRPVKTFLSSDECVRLTSVSFVGLAAAVAAAVAGAMGGRAADAAAAAAPPSACSFKIALSTCTMQAFGWALAAQVAEEDREV